MRDIRLPEGKDDVRLQSLLHDHPEDEDIRLTPVLLIKRQEYSNSNGLLSFPSIPPLLLWCWGVMLLAYPLWVILLQKYRADFQDDDWLQHYYYTLQQPKPSLLSAPLNTSTTLMTSHGGILPIILDVLTIWVLDISPRIAASVILFHSGICIAYYLQYA